MPIASIKLPLLKAKETRKIELTIPRLIKSTKKISLKVRNLGINRLESENNLLSKSCKP